MQNRLKFDTAENEPAKNLQNKKLTELLRVVQNRPNFTGVPTLRKNTNTAWRRLASFGRPRPRIAGSTADYAADCTVAMNRFCKAEEHSSIKNENDFRIGNAPAGRSRRLVKDYFDFASEVATFFR